MEKYPKQDLKKRLTPLQYKVTQQAQTEPAYTNKYNKCTKNGVYLCIVCNKPLFTSSMKFESSCGWPAFNSQIGQAKIIKNIQNKHGIPKVELRCSQCNSHLGHLFERGQGQSKKVRYCINSASLNLQEGQV